MLKGSTNQIFVHGTPGNGPWIWAKVPIVTGTSALGASLAMDFWMTDGPSASHNENYVHS
jgi:hypothetical protein